MENLQMKSNITSKLGWAGLLKIAFDRFRVYLAYIQMFMIVKLYLNQEGWNWWYLFIVPCSLIVIYFDIIYMFRGEQRANFDVHPYFPKLLSDVAEIKKHLGIEHSEEKQELTSESFAKGLNSAAWFRERGSCH